MGMLVLSLLMEGEMEGREREGQSQGRGGFVLTTPTRMSPRSAVLLLLSLLLLLLRLSFNSQQCPSRIGLVAYVYKKCGSLNARMSRRLLLGKL